MATDIIDQLRAETGGEDLDLSWLDKPLAERGLQVKPGKRGLTLEDISTSSYGDIPSTTSNQSGRLRGAAPRSDQQRMQTHWGNRSASWSESRSEEHTSALQSHSDIV